jgi:hypothetical protein
MPGSSTLCMTQFDYQRTKETKLKATYTLVKIRSQLFLQVRSTGKGGGGWGRGRGRAVLTGGIILSQQMSTSLGGRTIKGKVLSDTWPSQPGIGFLTNPPTWHESALCVLRFIESATARSMEGDTKTRLRMQVTQNYLTLPFMKHRRNLVQREFSPARLNYSGWK